MSRFYLKGFLYVQVLFKGLPLPDAFLSVIPRGKTLPPLGEENPYDPMTDMDGIARFTFDETNHHLLTVHAEPNENGMLSGKNCSFKKYAAALTNIVKQRK
jgi:hypothetical protein